jgi:hypothetical protein
MSGKIAMPYALAHMASLPYEYEDKRKRRGPSGPVVPPIHRVTDKAAGWHPVVVGLISTLG